MIGMAIMAGVSLASMYMNKQASDDAIDAQAAITAQLQVKYDEAYGETTGLTSEYLDSLDSISAGFDPFNMEQSYNSFYEGVILPMERDFSEHILPEISSAYTGMGGGAVNSGAQAESTAKARRGLSADKGKLLADERNNTINRNLQLDQRDRTMAKDRLNAGLIAPNLKMQQANGIAGRQDDGVALKLSSDLEMSNSVANMPGQILAGYNAEQEIRGSIADRQRAQNANDINEWNAANIRT